MDMEEMNGAIMHKVKQKFFEAGFNVITGPNRFTLEAEDGTTIAFSANGPKGAFLTIDANVVLVSTLTIND